MNGTACKEKWKTIKTEFETATRKKKPSPKVLGIFRAGTSIGSAFEAVDKAKDKAELKKALGVLYTKITEYEKLLKQNQSRSIRCFSS